MARITPFSLSSALALALSSLALLGCSSSEAADQGASVVTPTSCSGGPGCGTPCTTDPQCPGGQYCKAGTCGADCTPTGGECGTDSCGPDGRCVVSMTPANPTSAPADDGSFIDDMGLGEAPIEAGACIEVVTGFNTVIPTVLLLIDRSLSMDDPLPVDEEGGGAPNQGNPNPASRWDTVRNILTAPDTGLIQRLQADVRFGLSLYTAEEENGMGMGMPPNNDGNPFGQGGAGPGFGQGGGFMAFQSAAGSGGNEGAMGGSPASAGASATGGASGSPSNDSGPTCPLLVNVPIALNNYDAIRAIYSAEEPLYSTPTAASVLAATQMLLQVQEEGPKILILATDGEPGDCIYPFSVNRLGSEENRAASVQAVSDALAVGVETYVISVGDIGQDHLEDLATAGSADPDAAPYMPGSEAALEQAFLDIIGQAQSCTFELEGEVPASHASNGVVTLNGMALTYDDPNGWRMPDEMTVEVVGAACDEIQNGSGEVNIAFPCIPANEISR